MSDDLVKRLRDMCGDDGILATRDIYDHDVAEAADYIEKLEAALRTIYECCDETGNCSVVRRIVRKALEGEQ